MAHTQRISMDTSPCLCWLAIHSSVRLSSLPSRGTTRPRRTSSSPRTHSHAQSHATTAPPQASGHLTEGALSEAHAPAQAQTTALSAFPPLRPRPRALLSWPMRLHKPRSRHKAPALCDKAASESPPRASQKPNCRLPQTVPVSQRLDRPLVSMPKLPLRFGSPTNRPLDPSSTMASPASHSIPFHRSSDPRRRSVVSS